jgi:hypothetical protein
MSYYPHIDYMGAADRISRSLEDLPRVDREMEDRSMKKRLYDAQIANYELGARRAQREEEEYLEDKRIGRSLADDFSANPKEYQGHYYEKEEPADPDTDPITAPIRETSTGYAPPKKTIYGEMARALMASGRISEAMKAQEKEDERKEKRMQGLRSAVKELGNIYAATPSIAQNLHATYAEIYPELRSHVFHKDGDGKVRTFTVINPVTGERLPLYEIEGMKPVAFPERKPKEEKLPRDAEEAAIRLVRAKASGDPAKIREAQEDLNAMRGQKEWDARLKDAHEKKAGSDEKPDYTKKQANEGIVRNVRAIEALKRGSSSDPTELSNMPPGLQNILMMPASKRDPEMVASAVAMLEADNEVRYKYADEPIKKVWDGIKGVAARTQKAKEQAVEDMKVTPAINFIKYGSINPTEKDKKDKPSRETVKERIEKLKKMGWSRNHIEKAYGKTGLGY